MSRAHEPALEILNRELEEVVQVTEEEIADAMRVIFVDTHNVAEGAGAVAVAALLKNKLAYQGKRIGMVLSGGNVDSKDFVEIMSKPFIG